MKVKRLLLSGNVNQMNGYIISEGTSCFIVDPGYNAKKVMKYIDEFEFQVIGILLTHGHLDHIGQIGKLQTVYKCPIYISSDEMKLFLDDDLNGFNNFNEPRSFSFDQLTLNTLNDGDVLNLETSRVRCISTPGHTMGSMCYLVEDHLFSGDTLFKGTIGRTDLPTGNKHLMKQTLLKLIDMIPDNTKIHPGHGDSSDMKTEKRLNMYLK